MYAPGVPHQEGVGASHGELEVLYASAIVTRLTERHSLVLDLLAFHKTGHKADREHQEWQEGSHILSMMLQKLEYIHNNPGRSRARRSWSARRGSSAIVPS